MILPGDDAASIARGADEIRAGRLLGLPTETVYGLAADADNDAAVAQIFVAKGRPADHPLIVHVADARAADHYATSIPVFASKLMARFWPGPLTLILPRKPGVATAAAGGNDTIGLRCPAHPVAQALLKQLESDPNLTPRCVWGLAAPSANRFGRVSPTTAAHVAEELGESLPVLDGGPCPVGIESTIVDCTRGVPVLLRPGAISLAQIRAACGLSDSPSEAVALADTPAPKASGTLASHYAPHAKVRLMDAAALQRELECWVVSAGACSEPGRPQLAVWSRTPVHCPDVAARGVTLRTMPDQAQDAARQLFATLRAFDALGVPQIWVEWPPQETDWDGVRDRLQRAAH